MLPAALGNVRFRGQPGRHLLSMSSSQFDPSRTFPDVRFCARRAHGCSGRGPRESVGKTRACAETLTSGFRGLSQNRCTLSNRTKVIARRIPTSPASPLLANVRSDQRTTLRKHEQRCRSAVPLPGSQCLATRSNPWPNALHLPPTAACRFPTTRTASRRARAARC